MKKARTVAAGVAALAAVSVIGACSNAGTKDAAPSPATATTQTSTAAQAAAHNHADMMFAHMMIPHHEQAIEMSDIILAKEGIDSRVVDLATQIKAAQGPEIEKMRGWLKQWGMGMDGMPGHGGMDGMPGHGGMDGMPGHGGMDGMPGPGGMPSTSMMPTTSMMPGMGGMDDMPGMGGMDDMPGMGGMDGMMSPAEMDALKNAQGVEATRLFLTGMIKHHQGALTMARDEIANGEFPDAKAMATSILESQQKEIDTMNQILGSL